MKNKRQFTEDLAHLINRHSMENESNTPDFILAEYLTNCLTVFEMRVNEREKWYGRGPKVVLGGPSVQFDEVAPAPGDPSCFDQLEKVYNMAFRPITILKDIANKAFWAGSKFVHDNPPEKQIQKCLKEGKPIPDHLLPGRTILALPEEERNILKDLKSDDIKNDRIV